MVRWNFRKSGRPRQFKGVKIAISLVETRDRGLGKTERRVLSFIRAAYLGLCEAKKGEKRFVKCLGEREKSLARGEALNRVLPEKRKGEP